ncbi:MAG: hypothetical protein K2X87_11815, partial [Gemmataceae bacterium]|nr:hypothetical protein [Gemmataceae bacterium]
MKQLLMLLAAAGVAVGLTAAPARADKVQQPGALHVYDDAKLFSPDAEGKAKAVLSGTKFDHGLTLTVDTYPEIPADRRGSYDPAKKAAFFESWARSLYKGDRAKGIYVLVCMNPGWTEVLVDEESKNRGFDKGNAEQLRAIFDKAMRESARKPPAEQAAIRDAALVRAAEYVTNDVKGTTVAGGNHRVSADNNHRGGGMGIGGWICLGLSVLLGAWLVIGLIRALTGGGGGYGGGYGPGYGGGGGGFMSSLMGGLFGSMAGMWMYNNFFGGGGGM